MIGHAAVTRQPIARLRAIGATVAVALVLLAPRAHAQGDTQQKMAAFQAAQAQNAAAQRGYTWLETTTMAYKGDVKSTDSTSCHYLAGSNKAECTPVGPPPEEKKQHGPVRKHVAENKSDDIKTYMDSVTKLIAQYVPPQQDLIKTAQGRGDVATAPNPATGALKITISNYLQKGDAIVLALNAATNQLVNLDVNTWLNDPKATVTLAVQFTTLPSGVTFPNKKVITATAKEVVVTVTSSNFAQAAQ